jgi:hypothetical protein
LLSPLGGGVHHQVPPSKGKIERAFSALGGSKKKFELLHGWCFESQQLCFESQRRKQGFEI